MCRTTATRGMANSVMYYEYVIRNVAKSRLQWLCICALLLDSCQDMAEAWPMLPGCHQRPISKPQGLISLALLSARSARERWAALLWSAAVWDLTYDLWLRETVRWPASLSDPDVLFLIPVPWLAQVWFPMLVGGLTLLAVIVAKAKGGKAAAAGTG